MFILFLTLRGLISASMLNLYLLKGFTLLNDHKKVLLFIKSYLDYLYEILNDQNLLKIRGLKLQIKGRINGSTRFRSNMTVLGRLNLPRFNNYIDYNYLPVATKYGILGLKIYLNKLVFIKKYYAIKTKKNKIFKVSKTFLKKKQKTSTIFTKLSKY
jgi:hypothetical protein